MKPRLTFHSSPDCIPSEYWMCSGMGIRAGGLTPSEAFDTWSLLTKPLTEEQLQKARKALSGISYDTNKIQEAAESLPNVRIMCGKS